MSTAKDNECDDLLTTMEVKSNREKNDGGEKKKKNRTMFSPLSIEKNIYSSFKQHLKIIDSIENIERRQDQDAHATLPDRCRDSLQ